MSEYLGETVAAILIIAYAAGYFFDFLNDKKPKSGVLNSEANEHLAKTEKYQTTDIRHLEKVDK